MRSASLSRRTLVGGSLAVAFGGATSLLAPLTLDIPRKREPALVFGNTVAVAPRKVITKAEPAPAVSLLQPDLFSLPELAQATLW